MHFATNEELNKVLAQIDVNDPFGVRHHCMFTIARHTGLRVCELVGLDVNDVVDRGGVRSTLYVRPAIAKGNRGRTVPVNSQAREAIQRQLEFNRCRGFSTSPSAPLFVNRFHRRVIIRDVQRILKALREQAELTTPVTPHSIRRNFGTTVASTNNLRVVQVLLGHERLQTCEAYTRPSEAELIAAVERLAQ